MRGPGPLLRWTYRAECGHELTITRRSTSYVRLREPSTWRRGPIHGASIGGCCLLHRLTKEGSLSIGIPVRMSNGAPGNRQCTADFKIRVISKWVKAHGASKDNPAVVALGFSTDEIQRVKGYDPKYPTQRTVHPLIDLNLSRQDCAKIIVGAGLPVPPKSAPLVAQGTLTLDAEETDGCDSGSCWT